MSIDALVGQQAKEVGEIAAAPWTVGVCSCPPPAPARGSSSARRHRESASSSGQLLEESVTRLYDLLSLETLASNMLYRILQMCLKTDPEVLVFCLSGSVSKCLVQEDSLSHSDMVASCP